MRAMYKFFQNIEISLITEHKNEKDTLEIATNRELLCFIDTLLNIFAINKFEFETFRNDAAFYIYIFFKVMYYVQ